ncbi:solute carrier family 25 member 38 [Platysternon megacephalum]|uniref:Solute carrier family 25 member 38 n=1 Tax=Platysternon megacephalum TaxID=55544 RepID=A0A4D9ECG3_9SAUR|nr:solute carrier family 25 member 38 [Platysternon megacephalum]
MASCPAQLLAQDLQLLPSQALLQEWGWAHSDSTSPTSSSDSYSLSPSSALLASREPLHGCLPGQAPALPPKHRADPCRSSQRAQGRAGGGQRQSASEREKLRMRNLSKALHTLRRYLPPSVAPASQSLTKIETLRLAIRYISHLSELLGLSQETLAQRRGGPRRHCPLCPEGLGCCQARTPGLRAASPAPWEGSPPAAESWVSPPCCPAAGTPPEPHRALSTDTASWLSPPYCPSTGTPPELVWTQSTGAASWVSPTSCSETGTPPELRGAQISDVMAWGSPTSHPKAGSPPEPHGTASWGSCTDPAAPPEPNGIGATNARHWTSPTHCPLLAAFYQAGPMSPALDWSIDPSPQPARSHHRAIPAEPAQQQEWGAAGTEEVMRSRTSAAFGCGDRGLFTD